MSDKNKKRKEFKLPSAYTILLILTVIISVITQYVPDIQPSTVASTIMAPIDGLNNAIDIVLFIFFIGGFLGIMNATGALDAGVGSVVKRLKGKELMLIPILMLVFSLGGTTYGACEETIAFYSLVTATMMVAGFDPLVAVATIALGAGTGVLGSTVNPFLVGASIDAIKSANIEVNQGIIIALGVVLWLVNLLIAIYFVLSYAKKVKANPENTLLSKDEIDEANKVYLNGNSTTETLEITSRQKITIGLFGLAFGVMILGVIPWESFGITIFEKTDIFLGSAIGNWWFGELSIWFGIIAIIIGLVNGMKEKDIISNFMVGASDMMGVAMIIGISRGISVIMTNTGLGDYMLSQASGVLSDVAPLIFVNVAYLIFIGLSFLIPSTSGLATISMPIFAPLTQSLGFSPELIIMVFSAGSGIVNLVTPTSGVIMGGLAIAKVEYSTWLKFVWKVLLAIFIASATILSIAMMIL